MKSVAETTTLVRRAFWLVKLRWIAAVAICVGTYFASNVLGITLPSPILYSIAILLAFYNLIMLLLLDYLTLQKRRIRGLPVKTIINFQISADLLILTVLLHFSGGIENPLSFYFIFHMIIASILLSVRDSYLQATFAVLLFGLLILLEYLQLIPHHPLKGFVEQCLSQNKLYIAGTFFVFSTAMFTAVYMASYIATRLKRVEGVCRESNVLLRKKDHIKDEYVLRVTHDIKGHLAAIQSCLDVVAKKLVGPLNEQQQDFVDSANERTRKLTSFVKALLRLTQIRISDNLEMQIFSLSNTITAALNAVEAKAQDKTIALNSNIDLTEDNIFGDQLSIEEVITNLLFNAIKYTPQNGKVEINAKNEKGDVLVQIIDTGIGIPTDELPRVFDEFYRASNARKIEKDGTGLGLSIVKQIVESHNGKIWIESQESVGSTFSFTLPKADRSQV
ncbi:sensor histidine kinase [Planctomycetota bacterium]